MNFTFWKPPRDMAFLIQDLQILEQFTNQSSSTSYNELKVLSAKLHAKKAILFAYQKVAQNTFINTISLNTLPTGLQPCLSQIIYAAEPRAPLEALSNIE